MALSATEVGDLAKFELCYLATPYSKYPRGIEMAFIDAAKLSARLIGHGIKVYSPIVHTHPIAIHGKINPKDHSIWLPFDEVMMRKSPALIVAKMESWENSFGIAEEIKIFKLANKPIFYLNSETLELEDRH